MSNVLAKIKELETLITSKGGPGSGPRKKGEPLKPSFVNQHHEQLHNEQKRGTEISVADHNGNTVDVGPVKASKDGYRIGDNAYNYDHISHTKTNNSGDLTVHLKKPEPPHVAGPTARPVPEGYHSEPLIKTPGGKAAGTPATKAGGPTGIKVQGVQKLYNRLTGGKDDAYASGKGYNLVATTAQRQNGEHNVTMSSYNDANGKPTGKFWVRKQARSTGTKAWDDHGTSIHDSSREAAQAAHNFLYK